MPGELLQYLDAGATMVLAVVAIWRMGQVKDAMQALSDRVVELMTGDIKARTENALNVGKSLGHIDAQLGELIRETRLARGSDTKHAPAVRRDFPSDRD